MNSTRRPHWMEEKGWREASRRPSQPIKQLSERSSKPVRRFICSSKSSAAESCLVAVASEMGMVSSARYYRWALQISGLGSCKFFGVRVHALSVLVVRSDSRGHGDQARFRFGF
mmetsp:Transcript_23000/g.92079  ORF Transcript_23000/g.92079 Transcript_23000/m.92079 type:complete len:114 (+) Transcript_23000:2744-3085(+)